MTKIKDQIFQNKIDRLMSTYTRPKTKYCIYLIGGKARIATESIHKTKLGLAYRALCRLHYR